MDVSNWKARMYWALIFASVGSGCREPPPPPLAGCLIYAGSIGEISFEDLASGEIQDARWLPILGFDSVRPGPAGTVLCSGQDSSDHSYEATVFQIDPVQRRVLRKWRGSEGVYIAQKNLVAYVAGPDKTVYLAPLERPRVRQVCSRAALASYARAGKQATLVPCLEGAVCYVDGEVDRFAVCDVDEGGSIRVRFGAEARGCVPIAWRTRAGRLLYTCGGRGVAQIDLRDPDGEGEVLVAEMDARWEPAYDPEQDFLVWGRRGYLERPFREWVFLGPDPKVVVSRGRMFGSGYVQPGRCPSIATGR